MTMTEKLEKIEELFKEISAELFEIQQTYEDRPNQRSLYIAQDNINQLLLEGGIYNSIKTSVLHYDNK